MIRGNLLVEFSGTSAALLASDVASRMGNSEAADVAHADGTAAAIAYSLDHEWASNAANLATWEERSHDTESL